MNQIAREYKQAIIIGASPMGNEAVQLLALLKCSDCRFNCCFRQNIIMLDRIQISYQKIRTQLIFQ